MRTGVAVLLLCVALVGCGGMGATVTPLPTFTPAPPPPPPTATPIPPCNMDNGTKAYDYISQYITRWDDGVQLAQNTPRVSLAAQIATLQQIRRDFIAQNYPACAQPSGTAFVTLMDTMIDGFIGFLGQKPDDETNATFARAKDQQTAFVTELVKLPH